MTVDIRKTLYAAKLSQLRDPTLPSREVRTLTAELTTILADIAIEPPSPTEMIAVIVILRSGMVMMDVFLSKFPPETNIIVYHLGIFRDKKTLQPVEYYNKMSSKSPNVKHAYILDPVIATGGTADAAIQVVK
ncbi:hypothetical protein DV737_g1183, partial [Chaetothyriales sp. CBS 132003]